MKQLIFFVRKFVFEWLAIWAYVWIFKSYTCQRITSAFKNGISWRRHINKMNNNALEVRVRILLYRLFWIACVVCHFNHAFVYHFIIFLLCVCVFGLFIVENSHMTWRVRLRPFVNTCPFRTDFVSSLAQCECVRNCVCAILSLFVFVDHLQNT